MINKVRVKSLVQGVNPVPDATVDGLSASAREELVGPAGAVRTQRPSRRGILVSAIACTAAAVVATVAVLALNGSKEPGGSDIPMADEPYYRTTAALEDASVLIVRARLGVGHEETTDGLTETVATAQVLATAKGASPAGGRIELAYTTPGSGPETADLAAGKEYVLLLDTLDGNHFTPVNTTQGVYGVEDGHTVAGHDNDVPLSRGVLKALRMTR